MENDDWLLEGDAGPGLRDIRAFDVLSVETEASHPLKKTTFFARLSIQAPSGLQDS